ncbi:MAG: hypothetical protein ACLPJH_17310 [Myxococcaceae bacterium]
MTAGRSAWLLSVLLGCATAQPSSPAQAYLAALDSGQLDAAYALTSPAFRAQVSGEEFRARFADPAARQARAAAVREGLAELARAAPELFGMDETEVPEAVILRFVAAVRAGNFEQACACLSATLRQRYSAELLRVDFHAEPSAAERLERAAVAAQGIPVRDGTRVSFPVPGGGAVVVVQEQEGWKLEALQ